MKHSTYEILSTLVCLDSRNAHAADLMNTSERFTLSSHIMLKLHRFGIVVDMCKSPEKDQGFLVNVLITMPDLNSFRGFEGINEEYKTSRLLRQKFLESDFHQNYLCHILAEDAAVSLTFTDESELVAFAQETIDACGELFFNSEYSKLFYKIKERVLEHNILKVLLLDRTDISQVNPFTYLSDRKFTLSFDTSEIYCNTCLSMVEPVVINLDEFIEESDGEQRQLQTLTCENCGMHGVADIFVTF